MSQRILALFMFVLLAAVLFAQPAGTLRGVVSDESGAVIPGAKVTVTVGSKLVRSVTSGADGSYAVAGLPAGDYAVVATAPGLTQFQAAKVSIGPGTQSLNLQLRVAVESQQVTVQDTTAPTVTTDPASNAGQLILRQEDLQALSDDPDDLAADLQALAGPSAGPNGGQIFIDGFTGGRLPPKESIREVRINSNPFSSEYDRLGFGRIEIFTKPGTDKFRGMANFNISDGAFNSRNPYLTGASVNAPFQSRNYGANLSGPLSKKSSFFVDFERREINDDAIVNAQVLDPSSLTISPFSQFLATPQRRTTFSPRMDYQLSSNNTLMARYTYTRNDVTDRGVGDFSLPERGYNLLNQQHSLQLTDTIVVNAKTINETRFQYLREYNQTFGNNSVAALNVLQAFNGGGAQVGTGYDRQNRFELQNYTSVAAGKHAWKFGVRARAVDLNNLSPSNFGGTFSFAGGPGPQLDANNQPVLDASGQSIIIQNLAAIERYRRTLLFQRQHLTPEQIRALGGGATQFSLVAGNPLAGISQVDLGLFVQDDWRLAPNFTLSLGLRYEWQTNIHDWRDLGPRIGFAWAPGQGKAAMRPKTVIRGGFGVFYDRFSESYTLSAERLQGGTETQYIASNPDFFPIVPSVDQLSKRGSAITQVDRNLRAPYLLQTAIGGERQMPFNTTVAVTFTNSRALHLLRSRDINAPLPGTFNPAIPNSGIRPFGDVGEIDQFESTGVLNQNQIISNINTRIGRNVTLTAGYVLNFAKSNTDGATTFGANQYDLSGEYGRSSIDIRHRLFLNGSFQTKWAIRLSPFIIAHSGAPFNIYTSRDLYGDTLLNVARPAFAADPNAPGVVHSAFGIFDPIPKPGETIVPRNYGNGPSFFSVNLRVSKAFGFGGERTTVAGPSSGGGRGDHGGGDHGGGGGRGGFGGGSGGMRMGGGGHGGGEGGGTSQRYNIILSVQARNMLNTNNQGPLIGDVTSLLFGTSNRLAGGFGPEASPANNRRIEFSARFTF